VPAWSWLWSMLDRLNTLTLLQRDEHVTKVCIKLFAFSDLNTSSIASLVRLCIFALISGLETLPAFTIGERSLNLQQV
jgi:hypothetical protein